LLRHVVLAQSATGRNAFATKKMREVRIPAFAKVNLRLDVLGKRADGYHELRTIFQTISLRDELTLQTTRKPGITMRVTGNAALANEPVEKNLVWRAVDAVRHLLKQPNGVEIELRKAIPAGAGLGGGSSDAAAALLGYLRLVRAKLPEEKLIAIAAGLGADVPFFLLGGRALGVNKGDEIYPLPDAEPTAVLVVFPSGIHVPTPDAYRWLNARALDGAKSGTTPAKRLTESAKTRKLFEFCALCWSPQVRGLSNDFEKAVFRRHSRLAQIKRVLLQRGATEALLAGSGSAVFGVFPSPAKARRAAVGFPDDQTFVCEMVSRGGYARGMGIVR
jgi:4-diphosphocytidyl-2-C-methyl-D-erythritol kinase